MKTSLNFRLPAVLFILLLLLAALGCSKDNGQGNAEAAAAYKAKLYITPSPADPSARRLQPS